jgi:hypothetical protein
MSLVVIGVILLFAIPSISIAALVMTLSVRDQPAHAVPPARERYIIGIMPRERHG